MPHALGRALPPGLEDLEALALDLRGTWSHAADDLWRRLDPAGWARSENPWLLLQTIDGDRLARFAADPDFVAEVARLARARKEHLAEPGWYGAAHPDRPVRCVAYFSMEFGLGEALPIYAGGLGVLAGDYLKAASDLGVPAVGVGLLYQQGYFRQMVDPAGRQVELYPHNDPGSLPVEPVRTEGGGWLRVALELPGRVLHLRVWRATVGRVTLYLLDSNDPLNSPLDRGITGQLYGGSREVRLMQEFVLGIGGWRALRALGHSPEVLHLNEGHAAFAVLERARDFMDREGVTFREALWATRGGNVFTTHTAVAAGMDVFDPDMVQRYLPYLRIYLARLGVGVRELLGLGRRDPGDDGEPFSMPYLAIRGSTAVNGVSALHGRVSRDLFWSLFPRWPGREVPITHVTNGVHDPTWDSPIADRLWERACGKERWRGDLEGIERAIGAVSAEELWAMREDQRRSFVGFVRQRLARQLGYHGADAAALEVAGQVMEPDVLTLGFARRFAGYKRMDLLLRDPARLVRLLSDSARPVQLVLAGKAHPQDEEGSAIIARWMELARDPAVAGRLVFLEDYDMSLAQELVRGVDVWLNTPRRPWEASGTSGMKVLVNGGLNLSVLDGWWDEAFEPDVGWAIAGDGPQGDRDRRDAERLYRLLENEVVPAFYTRDGHGLPREWVQRMRASMARLTPRFSANRMVREYVERLYLPAAGRLRARIADQGRLARELGAWDATLRRAWDGVRFGTLTVRDQPDGRHYEVEIEFGAVSPEAVRVELFADAMGGRPGARIPMAPLEVVPAGDEASGEPRPVPGPIVYHARLPADRPIADFTPRVVPHHPAACVPLECPLIRWYDGP